MARQQQADVAQLQRTLADDWRQVVEIYTKIALVVQQRSQVCTCVLENQTRLFQTIAGTATMPVLAANSSGNPPPKKHRRLLGQVARGEPQEAVALPCSDGGALNESRNHRGTTIAE